MNKKGSGLIYLQITIIGGALICFAFIAYQIMTRDVINFDTVIREWVYAHRTAVFSKIFIAITYLGNWQTISILAAILLTYKGTREKIGVPFTITAIVSTFLYKAIKMAFLRPRPEMAVRLIKQGGYSFPSGHSMNGLVAYGILIYLIRRYCKNRMLANWLTGGLTALIILIGFSRVYVGVHFPTDILGGWLVGIAFLTTVIIVIEKVRRTENDL